MERFAHRDSQGNKQVNSNAPDETNTRIELSDRDFALFVEIMTADTQPTAVALREAAEFKGRYENGRYTW